MSQMIRQKAPLSDLEKRRHMVCLDERVAETIDRIRQRINDDHRLLLRIEQLEQENRALLNSINELNGLKR